MNRTSGYPTSLIHLPLIIACIVGMPVSPLQAQQQRFDVVPKETDLLSDSMCKHDWVGTALHWPRVQGDRNEFAKADSIPGDVLNGDLGWWLEHLLKKEYRPQDFLPYTAFVRNHLIQRDQVWTRFRTNAGTQIELAQTCTGFLLAIRPAQRGPAQVPSKEGAVSFAQSLLKTYLDEGNEAARALFGWSRQEDQVWHFRPDPPSHEGWMENADVYTDGAVVVVGAAKRRGDKDVGLLVDDCSNKSELDHWFDPPDKRPRPHYMARRYTGPGYGEIHTAIEEGVNNGNVDKVKEMVTKDPTLVTSTTPQGYTPLHMAAGYGNKQLVEFFLTHGADVNAKDHSGNTPLHLAVTYDRADVIELLIKAGADVNAKDNKGQTPLDQAEEMYREDAMKTLHQHGGKSTKQRFTPLTNPYK